MKTLLLLLVMTAGACAQAGPKAKPEQVKEALLKIEHDVLRANETCDRATFERVEAEEFIFTDSSGGVTDKKQDLASLEGCKPRELKGEIDEVRVQVYGEVAIVNARLTLHPTAKDGQPLRRRSRFTDVFAWRDGRWQMVLGHSSRIPETKAETAAK